MYIGDLERISKSRRRFIATISIHAMKVYIKFIYSEEATKFCEISTVDLSYVVTVKSTVEISQNFLAFSEYVNFNILLRPEYFVRNL